MSAFFRHCKILISPAGVLIQIALRVNCGVCCCVL